MGINRFKKTIIVAAAVAMVGVAGIASAQGMQHGAGKGAAHGAVEQGRHRGWNADLTDEQRMQIDALREDFFEATADLRGKLREKQAALAAELAKQSPDAAAATKIQGEVSALNAEMDAKVLAHRLEMRKIAPNADLGNCPMGGPMGGRMGMGQGGMMMGRGMGMGMGQGCMMMGAGAGQPAAN